MRLPCLLRRGLAVALAFTVVGTPALLLFMLLAQRSVRTHAVEAKLIEAVR